MHRLVANENSLYVKRFTFICVKTGPYNYSKMWRLSKSPYNNHFCRLVTLRQTYANSADTDHANLVQSVCSESALFAINDNILLSLMLDGIHLFIYLLFTTSYTINFGILHLVILWFSVRAR